MFNILLDELPTDWNGYQINSDFRIGIQITLAFDDPELASIEKNEVAQQLLFKSVRPDTMEALDCIGWFINGWCQDKHRGRGGTAPVMDFDADQGRIYTAFLKQYGIDLNTERMHWWKFMHLLTNLEECSFTRVVDIRAKQIDSKMSKEEREHYVKAKKIYSISHEDEEAQMLADKANEAFLKALGKG